MQEGAIKATCQMLDFPSLCAKFAQEAPLIVTARLCSRAEADEAQEKGRRSWLAQNLMEGPIGRHSDSGESENAKGACQSDWLATADRRAGWNYRPHPP